VRLYPAKHNLLLFHLMQFIVKFSAFAAAKTRFVYRFQTDQ